jgi:hypothetical protein
MLYLSMKKELLAVVMNGKNLKNIEFGIETNNK